MKIVHLLKPSKIKITFLIILIILGFLGYFFFIKGKEKPLDFAQAKKQTIRSAISSSGILTGKESAKLHFKSAGKIASLKAKEGDNVKAYDFIASLDTKQIEIDLQQARNSLVAKEAAAKKAEDEVKDHDKDETFSQKVTRTAAQTARDNAYDDVKAAQESLNDAYLYSPISGVITQASFVAGQNVLSTDLIAEVVNIEEIYFDTEVDEADISKVSVGQQAEVTLDAYPDRKLQGSVEKIIPQTKKTSSGATVIVVRIKLEEKNLTFINELSGQSEIITKVSKNTLTIPLGALREDNSVVIEQNGQLKESKVETGVSSDEDVEILSGVNEGDKVLLNPPPPGSDLNKK